MALRDALLPVIRSYWTMNVPMETYEHGIEYGGRALSLVRTGGSGTGGVTWSLYDGAALLVGPVNGASPEAIADLLGRAEAAVVTAAANAATTTSYVVPVIGAVVVLGVLGFVLWQASK